MLDAMMATTVHGNMNGSAAKHVCSSTAEFYEKPCRGTKQSFIHGALQNNVQHHLAGSASPSNLGSCTKCISICPCRLAPVQDASAHAHTLSNAVGIAKHVCSSTAEFNERPCKGTKHGLHTWVYAHQCKKRPVRNGFSRLWQPESFFSSK